MYMRFFAFLFTPVRYKMEERNFGGSIVINGGSSLYFTIFHRRVFDRHTRITLIGHWSMSLRDRNKLYTYAIRRSFKTKVLFLFFLGQWNWWGNAQKDGLKWINANRWSQWKKVNAYAPDQEEWKTWSTKAFSIFLVQTDERRDISFFLPWDWDGIG